MKSKVHLFFAVTLGIVTLALLQGAVTVAAEKVNLKSLRGETPLTEEPSAAALKDPPKDHAPEARNYLQQPPLIPHTIRDYKITRTHNKCMECHALQGPLRYRHRQRFAAALLLHPVPCAAGRYQAAGGEHLPAGRGDQAGGKVNAHINRIIYPG
jgi:hypothetical protein